ncbi:hypothetical protein H9Q72_013751 [Fusarium xylarioides]|uniref:2EXR domain-containing protein n=1 Tax=Fusarium xylarioides TaxID=221167 RepID=A0A9P7HL30_9HYPO|nr:hypothetical protein H9Q70_011390 [Fusarium xylarioides]KAG5758110.1 hypothetical protein H9Q72_013751 [Fusarium xylarioides]KAG5774660.1 hypothetical protein H9Q73_011676 [Fusarium xylarioides]
MGQSMSNDFESFNNLPPELRLMIWEEAVPKKKDTHAACKIFHDHFLRGLRFEKPEGADGPRPLLESCYDSRAMAMKSGAYMTVKDKKFRIICKTLRGLFEKRYHSVWVDNSITTLHVPIAALTCGRITNLPTSIQAIACMVPTPQALEALQKCLTHDPEYKGIKTVYLGIAGIPMQYSKGDDPDHYPCTESESAVVPLDDKKLINFLTSAYKAHIAIAIGDSAVREDAFHRKSALRFKKSLEKEWEYQQDSRLKWDPENGIKLVPAVIFGQKTRPIEVGNRGRLRRAALMLQISWRMAQIDLTWMDGFAYDNGAGNEDDLNELPYQRRLRQMTRDEKDDLRHLYWSPHSDEGEERWNATT